MPKPSRVLGTFTLAMITVSAIVSLRNLPLFAELGFAAIFYFVLASLTFFIPIALTTAELATGWPYAGGSYIWVGTAFGKRSGFFSLWMAWMSIIAWFPAILAFSAAMLAHLLSPLIPGLPQSALFTFGVMLGLFWLLTFVNFLGIEASSWVSTLGVLLGTVVPGVLIIVLGVWWMINGHPIETSFTWAALKPDWRLDNMVFFSGILLGLVGVEVAAYHVKEARDPKKDYPLAIILATFLILSIYILGTLAILLVIPQQEISLLSGLIQAFSVFFKAFDLPWMTPLLALCVLIGAIATVNAWIVGPAKGLLTTAEDHFLPDFFRKTNKRGAPVGMLLFQACVGSVLACVFLWMETHSAAYWVLNAISSQFVLVQYALMFAALVYLRYSKPDVQRSYQVPGGKFGVWLVAVVGISACLFGFWIVFVPPAQLNYGNGLAYQLTLAITFLGLSLLPAGIALHRKWKRK